MRSKLPAMRRRAPIDPEKAWVYDRFFRFHGFPADSEMVPLPIAGMVLKELRVEGNGKDCELCILSADGRRLEFPIGSDQLKIVTEGTVVTEVLFMDDLNLCIRYTAERLVLREALIRCDPELMDARGWDQLRKEVVAFETPPSDGGSLPKTKLTLEGRALRDSAG